MLRETKQSQGTLALFMWFAFFNTQLMFLLLIFIYAKLYAPDALKNLVFWDSLRMSDPLAMVLMVMAMTLGGLGLGLGFRYFSAVRSAAETPGSPKVSNTLYILSLVLCETVGLFGLMVGLVKGPVTLAVPFVLAGMALIVILVPSGGRFPKPR